jgi:UDP-N-acetylmuramoyl-tripeptide--D-alanyl-D-alanine ligase
MRVVIEETAGSTDPQRLVLVLGAMKELGDETESAHRELGMSAAEAGPKGIFLLGEETRASKTALEEAGYEGYLYQGDDFEELEKRLLGFVHSGDTVLLKGSRLMELERLVEPLQRAGEVYSGTGGGTAADSGKRSNAGTAADSGTQARGG